MAKWKNSSMTTAFLDKEEANRWPCEVIIDENRIAVDYIPKRMAHLPYMKGQIQKQGISDFDVKAVKTLRPPSI
jgi:hypothetical protein